MNREIKFRGWHVQQKRMYSAEEMATDQLTLLTTGNFINVSGTDTRLSKIYPTDGFIPLQFTGLKDKKGKEIYEGDILIHWDEKIIVDDIINFHYKIMECLMDETCEVIGNIYENPI